MSQKKNFNNIFISVLALVTLTQGVKAMPMFTQQTGMDCTGCHMQHMPRLNKFGRKFAASGMTISQHVQGMDHTSEMDINPSILIKSKYSRTWDKPDGNGGIKEDDTNDGDYSFIRMAAMMVGGRVSENFGALLNLGWRKDEGDSISGKAVYVNEIEDGYWGVSFYSTQGLGPFSGMEFYNTGLYKPLRTFDMRIYGNANQSTKIGAKAATGLQAYYDNDAFFNEDDYLFFTVGIYTPGQDNRYIDMMDNLLPFARIAYEYPIGEYNFILGAYAIVGGDNVSPTEELSIKRETYGMDLQIEGDIADNEASLTLTKVFRNKVEYTGIGAQLTDDVEDVYNDSFSVEGAVSVTDEVVLKAGYMIFNDRYEYDKVIKINVKDLDYAFNVGVDYGFIVTDMPMKLAVEYAWMQPTLERVEDYQSFMTTLTLPF